jgi:chloride channel 7
MLYNYFFDSGQEDYSFGELLPMAVIGVIGGLLGNFLLISLHTLLTTGNIFFLVCSNSSPFYLGALFNQLTLHITYWRRNYLHKNGNRVKVTE